MPNDIKTNIYTHPAHLPDDVAATVVAIGNFDGVHKGHQAILKRAKEKAEQLDAPLVALTFDPHPREVFTPENAPLRLTPLHEKARLLARYGVDVVYVIPFSRTYAQTTAASFIGDTLKTALKAKHVVVGEDFAFGRNREGDVAVLKAAGQEYDFAAEALPLKQQEGEVYSSTAIRAAIKAGDMQKARQLLGHEIKLLGAQK